MLQWPLAHWHGDDSREANYHKDNVVITFCDICQFVFGYIRKGQDAYAVLSHYF